ncbi:MAG: hypothetical protein KKI15_07670 [Proteobacteria bacterium]|nr:hypothetical protein [Pseudomonadota bacterium]
MGQINSEPEKIEVFLNKIWERKLWIITASFALFSINYIATNYNPLRAEYLTHLQRIQSVEGMEEEQHRQRLVIELYQVAINDLKPLLDTYRGHQSSSATLINEDSIKKALELSLKTRGRIDMHLSKSSGILLLGKDYQELHKRLLSGMAQLTALINDIEGFYKFSKNNESKQIVANRYNQVMHNNLSISESVIPGFSKVAIAETHAMQENMVKLEQLYMNVYFGLFCFLYLVIFLVVSIVKYVRHRNTCKVATDDAQ